MILLFLLPIVYGHVSLTFPEARFPPLDFLDTARTKTPCGVPKPANPHYTELVIGRTYNFTWRMQYPHQGGYRISLLDPNGTKVEDLAPMNGLEFASADQPMTQWESIRFNRPCMGCTVSLVRQAKEWGDNYQFMSCADVNVFDVDTEPHACSDRGTLEDGACQCEGGFTGDICQYHATCERDDDCRNNGVCVKEKDSLIKNSCYCAYGFFGRNCENKYNQANDACFAYEERDDKAYSQYGMFDENCYNREQFNDHDFIYHRKIKSDVEIILDFATSSWVSIGWRPQGLDPSCRLFPDLEGVSSNRPTRQANYTEEIVHWQGPPRKVDQQGPKPVLPKSNGLLDSTIHAPLHAMDCVDVFVGSVIDGRIRALDMYSRDRSTPMQDEWYDGENSFVAVAGVEMDGRTVIMFRRWIQEIEPTDHPLGPGKMFVVWAKGQDKTQVSHAVPKGIELKIAQNFYADDVLKYHGKNRGVKPLEFTIEIKPTKPTESIAFGVNTNNEEHLAEVVEDDPTPISSTEPPTTVSPPTIQSTSVKTTTTSTRVELEDSTSPPIVKDTQPMHGESRHKPEEEIEDEPLTNEKLPGISHGETVSSGMSHGKSVSPGMSHGENSDSGMFHGGTAVSHDKDPAMVHPVHTPTHETSPHEILPSTSTAKTTKKMTTTTKKAYVDDSYEYYGENYINKLNLSAVSIVLMLVNFM